jgi:hypothetical protein
MFQRPPIEWLPGWFVDHYRRQPRIVDELDRPRLGMSERAVASHLRPQGQVIVISTQNRPRAASTAEGMSQGK